MLCVSHTMAPQAADSRRRGQDTVDMHRMHVEEDLEQTENAASYSNGLRKN